MLAYDTFSVGGLTLPARLISTLTCQKIWTKTDQRCPSIFWAARVRTNIQGQIQKMKTTTHKLTHNDTHNDTQTHNYTQWHTLTYTHFLTHTFYRTLTHPKTNTHSMSSCMFHYVPLCKLLSVYIISCVFVLFCVSQCALSWACNFYP